MREFFLATDPGVGKKARLVIASGDAVHLLRGIEDQGARRVDTDVVLRHRTAETEVGLGDARVRVRRIGGAGCEQHQAEDQVVRDHGATWPKQLSEGVAGTEPGRHDVITVLPAQRAGDMLDSSRDAVGGLAQPLVEGTGQVGADRLEIWFWEAQQRVAFQHARNPVTHLLLV